MPWLIPVVVSVGVVCIVAAAVTVFFVRKGRAAKAEGAVAPARATATPHTQLQDNVGIYGSAASLHLGDSDNVGVYGSAPPLQHEYSAPPSVLSESRSSGTMYSSPPAVAMAETETEMQRL
jgi:hypothetical protein